MTETSHNAARVRHAVDSGETRDKVGYPDPAAAPLGTDDEAAGHAHQADGPPRKGDHFVDGDAAVGTFHAPESEEDNRAPASASPDWRTWGLIAAGIVVFGIAVVTLAG